MTNPTLPSPKDLRQWAGAARSTAKSYEDLAESFEASASLQDTLATLVPLLPAPPQPKRSRVRLDDEHKPSPRSPATGGDDIPALRSYISAHPGTSILDLALAVLAIKGHAKTPEIHRALVGHGVRREKFTDEVAGEAQIRTAFYGARKAGKIKSVAGTHEIALSEIRDAYRRKLGLPTNPSLFQVSA